MKSRDLLFRKNPLTLAAGCATMRLLIESEKDYDGAK